MSNKSYINGKGFEYACIEIFYTELAKIIKNVTKNEDKCYSNNKKAWSSLDKKDKESLNLGAEALFKTISSLEPSMIDCNSEHLKLFLQEDKKGEIGDVRDLVIERKDINWEIGFSLKHNNFAVKHNRLSENLDFGKKWYNVACSEKYFGAVRIVFENLKALKLEGKKWNELKNKEEDVYKPILNAFKDEIINASNNNKNVVKKLVEYMLGKYDFYKAICLDSRKTTQIQVFNMHGTLNRASSENKPTRRIKIVNLPTRIVKFDFKPNSKNTLELYLNKGWQFSFRIHNASTKVEPSVKFDVQIIGMPTNILTINSNWN